MFLRLEQRATVIGGFVEPPVAACAMERVGLVTVVGDQIRLESVTQLHEL